MSWLSWLINTDGYTPTSGDLDLGIPDYLLAIDKHANESIAVAYFFINICLLFVWWQKRRLRYSFLIFFYVAFLVGSGSSRFVYSMLSTWPVYNLAIALDVVTAIFAWCAAIAIPFFIFIKVIWPEEKLNEVQRRAIVTLNEKEMIHTEKQRLQKLVTDRDLTVMELKNQITRLQAINRELNDKKPIDDVIENIRKTAENLTTG